jgi:hypothetical protein
MHFTRRKNCAHINLGHSCFLSDPFIPQQLLIITIYTSTFYVLWILTYLLLGSTAHAGPWPPEQYIVYGFHNK